MMDEERFNKYKYIDQLKDFIKSDCKPDYDEIEQYIREDIDRECIYNATCYEICEELNPSGDFSDAIDEYGSTNISQFAYYELEQLVAEKIDINEIIKEMLNEN